MQGITKRATISCALLTLLLVMMERFPSQAQSQYVGLVRAALSKQSGREWRAASYRGLTVGKSTRADMIRVFGRPKRVDIPEGQRRTDPHQQLWYIYDGVGEFPGEFTVMIDKRSRKIVEMDLSPKNLTKEEAIRHFGDDYVITRYSFCAGFEEEDAAPIYESPNGALTYIEYREHGIALGLDYMNNVDQILYIRKPLGFTSQSGCRRERQRTSQTY